VVGGESDQEGEQGSCNENGDELEHVGMLQRGRGGIPVCV
jgi:hypothetical protein